MIWGYQYLWKYQYIYIYVYIYNIYNFGSNEYVYLAVLFVFVLVCANNILSVDFDNVFNLVQKRTNMELKSFNHYIDKSTIYFIYTCYHLMVGPRYYENQSGLSLVQRVCNRRRTARCCLWNAVAGQFVSRSHGLCVANKH